MAPDRRRQLLLGVVVVVLVVAVYRAWNATSTPAPTTSNQRAAAQPAGSARSSAPETSAAPDVHLEALKSDRPEPGEIDRNLFRFKPKAPPPPPPAPVRPRPDPVAPPVPAGPPQPPPPPPIQLKFIGIVERGSAEGGKPSVKVAVLSDAAGHVTYGVEGGTIDGRYRIVRIGEQSIELSYLDGRGRQTIRLTGS